MNENNGTRYLIWNATDSVCFDPRSFASEAEAASVAEDLRSRYAKQGYYLTADGFRIAPEDLELEIVPEVD